MNFKLIIKYVKILSVTAILFLGGLYFADRLVTPVGEIEEFYDEENSTWWIKITLVFHHPNFENETATYTITSPINYN